MEKYRGTFHGNAIEWDGESPEGWGVDEITVDVTVVSKRPKLKKPNGRKMAEALEKIAAIDGARVFGDPVKWQREVRKERPLPGRR